MGEVLSRRRGVPTLLPQPLHATDPLRLDPRPPYPPCHKTRGKISDLNNGLKEALREAHLRPPALDSRDPPLDPFPTPTPVASSPPNPLPPLPSLSSLLHVLLPLFTPVERKRSAHRRPWARCSLRDGPWVRRRGWGRDAVRGVGKAECGGGCEDSPRHVAAGSVVSAPLVHSSSRPDPTASRHGPRSRRQPPR